ncbi:MAG: NAD-dependent epimerase/dehydratase family protein [Alphaproteobacteria bacterium]
MKVLVTGSEGYIGAVLCPMLFDAGHDVVRLDSLLFEGCETGALTNRGQIERRDFRDLSPRDLAGIDAVIHLAALSNDPLANLDPQLTHRINHCATVRLATLAKGSGVGRFLFSSTCSVYGSNVDGVVTESTPTDPLTPYAASKLHAETDLAELGDDTFCVTSLRFGTAYGWSPMARFDLVVNNLAASARFNGEIRLLSDGTAWRPLIHVVDIAHSFLVCLEVEPAAVCQQTFNIGRTADNVRIIDLARIMADMLPGCDLTFTPDAGPDKRSYRVDFAKAEAALPGFAPVWSITAGVKDMLERVRQLPVETLRTLFHGRIHHLQSLRSRGIVDRDLRFVG